MSRLKRHTVAGGVVMDAAGRVLVLVRDIERGGRVVHEVRLPKGHLDPGETDEQAAVREVGEESGYWEAEIVADLGWERSEFEFRDRHHVRDEHYFLMRLTDAERRAPMPTGEEEALFQPAWLTPGEAEQQLTFASEQEFARRALERMDGLR
jgi:8-oxo-dGTP pyrophosphatase MutT (NUDIX family)